MAGSGGIANGRIQMKWIYLMEEPNQIKLRRGDNATMSAVVCIRRKGADGNSNNKGIPGRKETTTKTIEELGSSAKCGGHQRVLMAAATNEGGRIEYGRSPGDNHLETFEKEQRQDWTGKQRVLNKIGS